MWVDLWSPNKFPQFHGETTRTEITFALFVAIACVSMLKYNVYVNCVHLANVMHPYDLTSLQFFVCVDLGSPNKFSKLHGETTITEIALALTGGMACVAMLKYIGLRYDKCIHLADVIHPHGQNLLKGFW